MGKEPNSFKLKAQRQPCQGRAIAYYILLYSHAVGVVGPLPFTTNPSSAEICQMLVSPIHAEQMTLAMPMKAVADALGGCLRQLVFMCKPARGSSSAQMAGWPNTA